MNKCRLRGFKEGVIVFYFQRWYLVISEPLQPISGFQYRTKMWLNSCRLVIHYNFRRLYNIICLTRGIAHNYNSLLNISVFLYGTFDSITCNKGHIHWWYMFVNGDTHNPFLTNTRDKTVFFSFLPLTHDH